MTNRSHAIPNSFAAFLAAVFAAFGAASCSDGSPAESQATAGDARTAAQVQAEDATSSDESAPRAVFERMPFADEARGGDWAAGPDALETWSGRVLDAEGQAVAGALVTTRWPRTDIRSMNVESLDPGIVALPGDPAFQLQPGEAVTDAAGTFELRARCGPGSPVVVWARDRERHEFWWQDIAPDRRPREFELHFAAIRRLELELVDADGARVLRPRAGGSMFALVRLRLAHGERTTSLAPDPDGIYRVQYGAGLGDPTFLRVEARGFAPAEQAIDSDSEEPVRLVLNDALRIEVRARFDDAAPAKLDRSAVIGLRPFPASDADARLDVPLDEDPWLGSPSHVSADHASDSVPVYVDLDVPYFVVASHTASGWRETFGPWKPGSIVREIVIPPLVAPPAQPRWSPKYAQIRVLAMDAEDGAVLVPQILFESAPERAWYDVASEHRDGPEFRRVEFSNRSGSTRIRVGAAGYRATQPIEVEFTADGVLELGTFRLERLPLVEFAVLVPSGSVLAPWSTLDPIDADGREMLSEGALIEFDCARARLDPSLVNAVRVTEHGVWPVRQWLSQTVKVRRVDDRLIEARIAAWVELEVRVPTASPLERESKLVVYAEALGGELVCKRELTEVAPDADARRFRGRMVAGEVRIVCAGPLVPKRETSVTLQANYTAPVVIDLPR